MKVSLFSFLILFTFIKLDNIGNYSIEVFLNYLQITGFYDLLSDIKYKKGSEVAIYICKIFFNYNPYCDDVVRVYIPNPASPSSVNPDKNVVNIMDIILKYEYILRKIFTKEELDIIKSKIFKKYKIFDKSIDIKEKEKMIDDKPLSKA